MTLKKEASHRFTRIASMIELLGEDPFRASANARAARTLDAYPGNIEDIIDDEDALKKIPGIGAKMAAKMAGISNGRVISRSARAGLAPKIAAASPKRGFKFSQKLPTVRTTTLT